MRLTIPVLLDGMDSVGQGSHEMETGSVRPSERSRWLPGDERRRAILSLALPIIGRIGTDELAVSNVLVHLLLVAILPGLGFGMASATLVGQALGRRDPDAAHRWAWDVVILGVAVVAVIASVGAVVPDLLLGLFLHDDSLVALGRTPLRILAIAMPVDTVGLVLLNSILGAGDTRRVMVVSVALQWLLFLPAAWVVGPWLGLGLVSVWIAHAGYRALQTAAFVAMWQRRRWADVAV